MLGPVSTNMPYCFTVITSKHPNFGEDQTVGGKLFVCLVDADPVAIKSMRTGDICLDSVHGVELFMSSFSPPRISKLDTQSSVRLN